MLDALSMLTNYDATEGIHGLLKMVLKDLGLADITYSFSRQSQTDSQQNITNLCNNSGPAKIMVVVNKMDLISSPMPANVKNEKNVTVLGISCNTQYGLPEFMEELKNLVESL